MQPQPLDLRLSIAPCSCSGSAWFELIRLLDHPHIRPSLLFFMLLHLLHLHLHLHLLLLLGALHLHVLLLLPLLLLECHHLPLVLHITLLRLLDCVQ